MLIKLVEQRGRQGVTLIQKSIAVFYFDTVSNRFLMAYMQEFVARVHFVLHSDGSVVIYPR